MLIRAEYARDLLHGEEDGYAALAMVVRPSPELLAASLARAEEEGVGKLARSLASSHAYRERRVEGRPSGAVKDRRPLSGPPVERAARQPITWAS